jgi:hypothetical protein
LGRAERIRNAIDGLLGSDAARRAVFMGRIGAGRPARARSVRLPLARLLQPTIETDQKKSPL